MPTGVTEDAAYGGIVYYEEKGVDDVMTFTAAKKFNALFEVHILMCITYNKLIFVVYQAISSSCQDRSVCILQF